MSWIPALQSFLFVNCFKSQPKICNLHLANRLNIKSCISKVTFQSKTYPKHSRLCWNSHFYRFLKLYDIGPWSKFHCLNTTKFNSINFSIFTVPQTGWMNSCQSRYCKNFYRGGFTSGLYSIKVRYLGIFSVSSPLKHNNWFNLYYRNRLANPNLSINFQVNIYVKF